jgi:predicted AlkP superfamily phosphohydrolase/phosphomutase
MYGCNIQAYLAERGLVAWSDERTPRGTPKVDPARSKVYMHGGLQICVNLRGRDPYGLVDPDDFEQVQEEIVDALLDLRDPASGKRAIALALKKKDAPLIGFYGETAGDVVFVYASGFGWTAPRDGLVGIARGGANHGPQLPTARTAFSSNLAVFMARGPGIRAGYERDRERLGLIRLVDVVPTICHLLGIQPPAQSSGSVLWDIFE